MPSLTGITTSKLFGRLGSKSSKTNSEQKTSKRRPKSSNHASLECLIKEQNWEGALKWLVQEELLRYDMPYAWLCDSYSWRDDWCSEGGSENSILSISCSLGAPVELVDRIMMMYPLMIGSIGTEGKTPLHVACLIRAGADVIESLCNEIIRVCPENLLLCDEYGLTAFDYAVETNLPKNVLDLLKQEMQEMEDEITNPDECVFRDKFPIKNIFISFNNQ